MSRVAEKGSLFFDLSLFFWYSLTLCLLLLSIYKHTHSSLALTYVSVYKSPAIYIRWAGTNCHKNRKGVRCPSAKGHVARALVGRVQPALVHLFNDQSGTFFFFFKLIYLTMNIPCCSARPFFNMICIEWCIFLLSKNYKAYVWRVVYFFLPIQLVRGGEFSNFQRFVIGWVALVEGLWWVCIMLDFMPFDVFKCVGGGPSLFDLLLTHCVYELWTRDMLVCVCVYKDIVPLFLLLFCNKV